MLPVSKKRTYGDPCGIARALDVVGERWALLISRELLLGPKRFTDLRAGLPNVGPDVLSQRLRELEQAGVVRRGTLPPPAGSRVYELTDRGHELEPVLLALGRWGSRAQIHAGGPALSADALVIALKTLFDPRAAGDLEASYELRLGEHSFGLSVANGRLDVTRTTDRTADARIATDTRTLAQLLWHGGALAEPQRSGRLELDGDTGLVAQLLELFPATEPAGETSYAASEMSE